jgi:L-rhamnose mutarotase
MPLTSAPKIVRWTVFLLEYRELEFTYTLIAPDEQGIDRFRLSGIKYGIITRKWRTIYRYMMMTKDNNENFYKIMNYVYYSRSKNVHVANPNQSKY